jgi:hypothetical protein
MRVGALALLGMLTLSGCGGGTPIPTLPPTPTATPVFASEEEALAAAEEAYAAYSEMSDLISSQGGADPERLAPYVTAEQLAREIDTANYFSANGLRADGRPVLTRFDLQQYSEVASQVEIVVYVCLDVSAVLVRDADGADVTPANRQSVVPLEVAFVASSSDTLLIANSDVWSGSSFC